MARKKWKVIALSCRKGYHTQAFQKELEIRQSKGLIDPNVLLLTVEDPDTRIGSGGATINTILVVAEHLSSLAGHTVVNPDVLANADILILLMGRNYLFDPCGRAFTTMPAMYSGAHHITGSDTENIACNIDFIIYTLTNVICPNSPPGVWVCSTDMLLSIPSEKAIDITFPKHWKGVSLITVPASVDYATLHGACKVNHDDTVDDIFYQSSPDNLESCLLNNGHQVPLVSGLLFMCPNTATKLLQFHVKPPIDACTYMGIDSGSLPIKLSLFFDILLPMANNVSRENFVTGNRSGSYGNKDDSLLLPEDKALMEHARSVLYDELHQIRIRSILITEGIHNYMSTSVASDFQNQILNCPLRLGTNGVKNFQWQNRTHCYTESGCEVPISTIIINSSIDSEIDIGKNCVVAHCILKNSLKIGNRCILSGLLPIEFELDKVITEPVVIPDKSVMLNFIISIGDNVSRRITTVFGLDDNLMLSVDNQKSSFCNKPWSAFFERTGIDSSDLWQQHLPSSKRSLFNAKLYPVFNHIQKIETEDILWLLGTHNSAEALEK
ncbi:uncharacterized protein TRIADDRAFT_55544 [Trichoplax adhaerens]|uniref:GDP-fucose pyrophosphorylase domain-containing protein n=1 Tax=Trichoplax adhaerens TaxID=10228 RepID=B3RV67_TRIAD|nr:hypothetical protein TRIADDRAFT_55544 [Trichoplax adhaerens]EDV25942.1 hypothetical protein TRIADDRAFT_55544 [Trichoplax adhaerens]|eukprot:XP_002111975.1 hypothetical protein TRIADDRAFT_55544 [Trichoplax adhaerens]